jgi:hypothetical protein
MRLPIRLTAMSVLAFAALGFGTPAEAGVREFPAAGMEAGNVVFPLRGVQPREITGVSILIRRHGRARPMTRSLRLKEARRAVRQGALRVPAAELGAPIATAAGESLKTSVAGGRISVAVRNDTAPPETTITAAPAEVAGDSPVTFRFVSSEKRSSFRCSLDGALASCGSPWTYDGVATGSHVFAVAATDRAGNADATPATSTFTVKSPPVAEPPVTQPPATEPLPTEPPATEPPATEPPATEPPATEPPPSEPPTASGCEVPSLFSAVGPPACWRPYGASSPFNRSLPAAPRLDASSGAIVSRLTSWGNAQGLIVGHPEGNDDDYGHPVYYASPSDPVYTIHCTQWTSSCGIEGMRVRIPAAARPTSGSDAHMVVIDQENGWEYDFWQVHTQPLPAAGGKIEISHGGRTRWGTADATGLGSNATAAHFGLAAGVVRADEWSDATAEAAPIDHALTMSVRCTSGSSVYPAAPGSNGLVCPESSRAGAPPIGAHFYLAMSDAQIQTLAVPAWKKPILLAMAHYGLFVGDTFGGTSNSFGLSAESDVQYRSLGLPGRYAALGKKWGIGTWNGAYVFDIASGIDWARYLKVVDPCVAAQTC